MDISIIIVNYNTSDLLNNCLNSIKRETNVLFEIIVIDNNSNDGSLVIAARNHPGVIVIENKENIGFARANNQGMEIAAGRYILLLNPDTVILEHALDRMVDFMDKNSQYGVCGPKNLNSDLSLQYNCHHFPSLVNKFFNHTQIRMIFPKMEVFGRADMTYWDYNHVREVDWITGACLLVRKDALDDVGLLDPNYFLYSEETDWCLRAKKRGWPTVFLPEASIIHYYGSSAQRKTGEKVFSMNISRFEFESQYYYFKKNKGLVYSILIRLNDLMCYVAIYMAYLIKYGAEDTKKNKIRLSQYLEYIKLAVK